jgi:hypothetical protein
VVFAEKACARPDQTSGSPKLACPQNHHPPRDWTGLSMGIPLLSSISRGSWAVSPTILRHLSTQSRIPRAKKAALTIVGPPAYKVSYVPPNRYSDAFRGRKASKFGPGPTPTANSNRGAQQRVCRFVLPLRIRGQAGQVR